MHQNRASLARRSLSINLRIGLRRAAVPLSIASALSLGCGSNDDVVATAVQTTPDSSPSGGIVTVVNGGATIPATGGGTPSSGAGTSAAPFSGTSMMTAPLPVAFPPPFVPLGGAVFISGTPRPSPSGDAERWPFRELLHDVFGVPPPNEPAPVLIEADPVRAEALRQLGDDYGFESGVAAAMLVVVDEVDEQYDITIWDRE
jgi:hypothetical protein